MGKICLDAHILIWGLQRKASPERRHMISRAQNFLKYLSEIQITLAKFGMLKAVMERLKA